MGRLTTHVLDLMQGKPAQELKIHCFRVNSDQSLTLLRQVFTNHDGRIDSPLLTHEELIPGIYELHFYVGDYFRLQGIHSPQPSFLDIVPLRFGIQNPHEHYHVPLLVAPGGYSTYRGS
ncbi:hydroxyisourate hydrolase [Thermoflavimicrobium daqui]|uniref:5-hydroxyisourate hydrolase n=1 Tax=Thermoflavimicrobium daqui TaxID=2137476 RepID=A0A364K7D9_9BACL|nr:hydroxyisourate hydrolase [Thermoflavimicrobium daqui]RAL26213.1 hydroxyisourate hydrolase [Thermoflavimicrobium daqui]